MKCLCGKKLELSRYTRDHQDGLGPHLVYECMDENCKLNTQQVKREHLPGGEQSLEELRNNYFRHALEIPHE